MKKNYIILSAFTIAVGILSFQKSGDEKIEMFKKNYHLYPGGIGTAVAGAPGDANCTQCHTGSTQDGASINTVTFASGMTPVTEYTPSATYNVALTMAPNPTKKGFQAIAMDDAGNAVGTFATISLGGAQIMSGRATHTSSSNTSANTVWAWSWTAPSTNVGDVTFYVASMSANGTGTSGDVVYLSQHVIGSTAGVKDQAKNKFDFTAGYSSTSNSVVMNFNSLISGKMYFNLVDMNGRSVYTYDMGNAQIGKNNEKIILPSDLKNGMYVVNMFVNNNAMSQKIMIQK